MTYTVSVNARKANLEISIPEPGRVRFRVDGAACEAEAVEVEPDVYLVLAQGRSYEVRLSERDGAWEACCRGQRLEISVEDPRRYRRGERAPSASGAQVLTAPMPGKVVKVLVATGEEVEAGQGIAVVEAMKMQNEVRASRPGRVARLPVEEGGSVTAGETLAVIE